MDQICAKHIPRLNFLNIQHFLLINLLDLGHPMVIVLVVLQALLISQGTGYQKQHFFHFRIVKW